MHNWIIELIDEYGRVWKDNGKTIRTPNERQVKRLAAKFSDIPAAVMETAVNNYIDDANKYFPGVSGLRPYVDDASHKHNDGFNDSGEWTEAKRQRIDAQLYAYEKRRGNMPTNLEPIPLTYPIKLASGHVVDLVNGRITVTQPLGSEFFAQAQAQGVTP